MSEQTLNEIERLAVAFDRAKIGPERIALYVAQLADLPVEQLAVVVDRLIRTSRFFPTVSEMLGAWAELVLGPPDPHGALAWVETERKRLAFEAEQRYWAQDVLSRGIQRPAIDPPTIWRDPVTQETVRLCGWEELAEMPPEYRAGYWAKQYATARQLVAKRLQAGDGRLPLPETERMRSLRKAS